MTALREQVIEATKANASFSKQMPGLQIAVDSTSLGTFKECPRKYLYSIILGIVPKMESVHLRFGLLMHGATEVYEHRKLELLEKLGKRDAHESALKSAVQWVMEQTWDQSIGKGWWSDHPTKNRLTLVRSVVWYLDWLASNEAVETMTLENGRPAVELSFRFLSGFQAITGEDILLCGHLDKISKFNGMVYVGPDIKTTGSTISARFFDDFSPGNQMSMYSLAGKVCFKFPVEGVLVDGLQVAATFSKPLRGLIPRTDDQLDEWLLDTGMWLQKMEQCAEANYWPQNDKACHNYGGCQFRKVCGVSPGRRRLVLENDFTKRVWDPLVTRGDI